MEDKTAEQPRRHSHDGASDVTTVVRHHRSNSEYKSPDSASKECRRKENQIQNSSKYESQLESLLFTLEYLLMIGSSSASLLRNSAVQFGSVYWLLIGVELLIPISKLFTNDIVKSVVAQVATQVSTGGRLIIKFLTDVFNKWYEAQLVTLIRRKGRMIMELLISVAHKFYMQWLFTQVIRTGRIISEFLIDVTNKSYASLVTQIRRIIKLLEYVIEILYLVPLAQFSINCFFVYFILTGFRLGAISLSCIPKGNRLSWQFSFLSLALVPRIATLIASVGDFLRTVVWRQTPLMHNLCLENATPLPSKGVFVHCNFGNGGTVNVQQSGTSIISAAVNANGENRDEKLACLAT